MAEYIEREELLREFDELEPDEEYEYEHALWLDMREEAIHAKSADVAPVRKGRWESVGLSSLRCSDCGYLDDMKMYHRYCPDCGCFMR